MADRAVVIGINSYPGIGDLEGPCDDAQAFADWLRDPSGGGLDPENVDVLLSRDLGNPTSVADARPVLAELEARLRPLAEHAALHEHEDGRLFFFVAGHGFADPHDIDSAALFTADAALLFSPHLAVVEYANFFRRTWAFDEVILIMDACRTTNLLQQISIPPVANVAPHANASKVKRFFAFGSGFNLAARERSVNGTVRGIFTMALLDALNNAPANNAGRVNGTAVKDYIHTVFKSHANGTDIADPDIVADDRKDVFFVARQQPGGFDVKFSVGAEHLNRTLVIEFGGVEEVHRAEIGVAPVTADLRPGLYKVRIDGTDVFRNFEVPTDEQINL